MTTFAKSIRRNNKKIENMIIQDKAYQLMTIKADLLEVTLGERTNVETVKEGKTSFSYKVWFCNSNNKIQTRIIKVSVKGY